MNRTEKALTEFMFFEDDIKKSDIIIVPGKSQVAPVEISKKLLDENLANYVIFSGGVNDNLDKKNKNLLTESDYMKNYGLQIGIDEEKILVEKRAGNTLENVLFSAKLIKKHNLKPKRIILICKNFHARRVLYTFENSFPIKEVEFFVKSYIDKRNITADNWTCDDDKKALVYLEIKKIGSYFGINGY